MIDQIPKEMLKIITEQYNEGLIAMCNTCQQLTYNTSAFVCINCHPLKK